MEGADLSVRYRSGLQNYVIDTGNEVILADTGMPAEAPDAVPDEKTVIYMGNPPETIPVGEIRLKEASGRFICSVCGYVYDPAEQDGTAFEDLPEDWKCPRCRQPKDKFNKA